MVDRGILPDGPSIIVSSIIRDAMGPRENRAKSWMIRGERA
jgi:hypothetical protein